MARLFASELSPSICICNDCIAFCTEALAAEGGVRSTEPPPAMMVPWTGFEVDGQRLEWCASRVMVPRKGKSVMVAVRRAGDEGDGEASLYPLGTEPGVKQAEETARKFLEFL